MRLIALTPLSLRRLHLTGLAAENTFTGTEAAADQTHSISSVGTFTPRRPNNPSMRESLTFDIAPYLMGRAPAKAQQFVRKRHLLFRRSAVIDSRNLGRLLTPPPPVTQNPQQLASLEGANAELISKEIESIAIDRLFTDSIKLNNVRKPPALVYFESGRDHSPDAFVPPFFFCCRTQSWTL